MENLSYYFYLISSVVLFVLPSKVKIIISYRKIVCISYEKFQKLTSKTQVSFVNEAPVTQAFFKS
jgi:hypothetical protein